MPERIRNEWVKKLGKREDWSTFGNEWKKLPEDGRDEESSCYGQLYSLRRAAPRPTSTVFWIAAASRKAVVG
ncbi:hypothetical protein [Paludibacterium denitrificans]|uniref:hypothetical protein n=1 Tax=Paludibacterium denitrificans TaxID=2675226 RepID=UPI001E455B65|nr:hypothetical protein [Paludibacterium denitrificans]